MSRLLELLNLMPKAVQIAIAGMLIGGLAFAGHEVRYMTVGQFTKSYVLDLKSEIRAVRRDLNDPDLDERTKRFLREILDQMLDELCYEAPNDLYCQPEQ